MEGVYNNVVPTFHQLRLETHTKGGEPNVPCTGHSFRLNDYNSDFFENSLIIIRLTEESKPLAWYLNIRPTVTLIL